MTSRRDKQRYVCIEFDGSKCVCEPSEASGIVESMRIDEQDADILLSEVWMTKAEFERLSEFQGY